NFLRLFGAPRANRLRTLKRELEGLERPSVSHHHLNALEHSKMIVAWHVRKCEGYHWIGPENDFGRHATKRYQNSNIRRRRRRLRRHSQTADHIEAARYHVINLVPWSFELARGVRGKGLSISLGRKEQSV